MAPSDTIMGNTSKMKAYTTILERFYNQYVNKQDQVLLDLVLQENPTQAEVDACLAQADIEALGAAKCLLLTYLTHNYPNLQLNAYAGPRIQGLQKYFHFHNTKTLSHFSRLGKALNEAGIPFILFKGGAMRALRPDLPRHMGDTDILLPAGTIKRAVKIGEGLGYQHIHGKPTHAIGLHTDTEDAVDLHYHVFDEGRDLDALEKGFFERAKPFRAFGVDFLMPAPEDLFFLILNNFTKNLREKTTLGGLYFAMEDARWLLENTPDFDFEIVRQNAVLGDKELETRFAADFMNRVRPGLIPDVEKNLPFTSQVSDFCNLLVFDEKVFRPLYGVCQAMRVAELRNYPWMNGKRILKFLIFNRLRKRPAFVAWYIKNRMSERWLNAN